MADSRPRPPSSARPHIYPAKPRPGDRVAILSPSTGLPGILPLPYELGLRRLREDFGLDPIEYPTTRQMHSTPEDRAADIHAAFADPDIRAVITSIGGDDQIRVLPHLDRAILAANPKPFFGYSDNTNLLVFLWNAGVVGYHGSSVMFHLGRPGAMHPLSAASLRAALFTSGAYELAAAGQSGDTDRDWADSRTFETEPDLEPVNGWTWHNAEQIVEGPTWGGNLEILSWLAMADREIAQPDAYEGAILLIETSEDMPSAAQVGYILQGFGERGLLGRFRAVVVGRAKAWTSSAPSTREQRAEYRSAQRSAILSALDRYAPSALVVFDVDVGHTDPQLVIPIGGRISIDGPARQITVQY
jgi:muramoyltetrapeptide carboxypeptidase LdcA involved in peptidoglycan recycling